MKAPDKIYFGYDENTHLESYCLEKKGKTTVEYIRKDTLMEWIKEKIEENVGQYNKDWDLAFNEIIDKINSL